MQLHDEVAEASALMKRVAGREIRADMQQANEAMTHVANALTILSRCVVVGKTRRGRPDSQIASQLIEAQTYLQQFLLRPEENASLVRAMDALSILDKMFRSMDVYEFPLRSKGNGEWTLSRGGMVRGSGGRARTASSSSGFRGAKAWRGPAVNRVIYDEVGSFIADEDL